MEKQENQFRFADLEKPVAVKSFTAGNWIQPQRNWLSSIQLIRIDSGSYQVEVNLKKFTASSGDLIAIHPDVLYQLKPADPMAAHTIIYFNPEIFYGTANDFEQETLINPLKTQQVAMPVFIGPGTARDRLSSLFEEIENTWQQQDDLSYLKVKNLLRMGLYSLYEHSLLSDSASQLSKAGEAKIRRYKETVDYMNQHYASNISLKDLAEITQLNEQYLCRCFKEITGITPIQYLIQVRLEHACKDLIETDRSVFDIAAGNGFGSVSYFIRRFKETYHTTPHQYRAVRPLQ